MASCHYMCDDVSSDNSCYSMIYYTNHTKIATLLYALATFDNSSEWMIYRTHQRKMAAPHCVYVLKCMSNLAILLNKLLI